MIPASRPFPLALQGGGVLALGTLLLFTEVIFRGRVFFYGDLSLYFLPQLDFLRSELLAGRIPLWNPYINCGQPFVGNPQTWPLYPSSLLLLFFEAARANAIPRSEVAAAWATSEIVHARKHQAVACKSLCEQSSSNGMTSCM